MRAHVFTSILFCIMPICCFGQEKPSVTQSEERGTISPNHPGTGQKAVPRSAWRWKAEDRTAKLITGRDF